MPHIIVKLWPGKTDAQKQCLTDGIIKAVETGLGYGEEAVSVAFEEIEPEAWKEKVYDPDIVGKAHQLLKKPGYKME